MANYDILGNIAIVKFNEDTTENSKMVQAERILSEHKGVKTVLEKIDRIKGRLRTIKTRYILGENNLIAEYKENNCLFKFNVGDCYFSPRLSRDRREIAEIITKKKCKKILIMFSGVGPYPIVISKFSNAKEIVSIELGKECCRYALLNSKKNKVGNINFIQGDVKKIIPKLNQKFDFIVMCRPNLKDSFLKYGLMASKKGAFIYYHGFSHETEKDNMISNILKEAEEFGKRLKLLDVRLIGEIAPYKFRYGLLFKVF